MENLTLAIMAAGMGSRYGGMKQLDKFGMSGEILMEYSIYDAIKAGFTDIIIITKDELLDTFKETAGDRLARNVNLNYAFQRLDDVPGWFTVPGDRAKPWGTAQAAASLDGVVKGPFCIINADDFYGSESYRLVADYLKKAPKEAPYSCCMVGYGVENTLSEFGAVTRGVCDVDGSRLKKLVERYKIVRRKDGVIVDEDSGVTFPEKTSVSMNMFGFQDSVPALLKERFGEWLRENDLQKGEYLLPAEVNNLVADGLITMDVLPTSDKWYGVTYKEDKVPLVEKIREKIASGEYPERLWEK